MTHAALVYQAGIANVFEVERPDGLRRLLLQSDFQNCVSFVAGLRAAGVKVKTYACNRAGNIAGQTWTEDLDSAPWSEKFARFEDF
jgi:hypothetical protein